MAAKWKMAGKLALPDKNGGKLGLPDEINKSEGNETIQLE